MERVHLLIEGRVQGVFYRANAQKVASELGLKGFVRNTEDGGVEAEAEGKREKLEELIAWCNQGPPAANVTTVRVEWLPATGEFKEFSIRY